MTTYSKNFNYLIEKFEFIQSSLKLELAVIRTKLFRAYKLSSILELLILKSLSCETVGNVRGSTPFFFDNCVRKYLSFICEPQPVVTKVSRKDCFSLDHFVVNSKICLLTNFTSSCKPSKHLQMQAKELNILGPEMSCQRYWGLSFLSPILSGVPCWPHYTKRLDFHDVTPRNFSHTTLDP